MMDSIIPFNVNPMILQCEHENDKVKPMNQTFKSAYENIKRNLEVYHDTQVPFNVALCSIINTHERRRLVRRADNRNGTNHAT